VNYSITSQNPHTEMIADFDPAAKQREIDQHWWKLFDVAGAVAQVDNHIKKQGSERTPERNTRSAYEGSLLDFLRWLAVGDVPVVDSVYELVTVHKVFRCPLPGVISEYIAACASRGLATSTINRYLAPIRHWIKALRKQYIPVRGDVRDLVNDVKDFLLWSLDEKPEDDHKSTQSALHSHGTRLTQGQMDAFITYLAELPEDDLRAARDLALVHLAFNTGLRDAELRRLRLSNIEQRESHKVVVVRGKRNNFDPVPLDEMSYKLIMRWVDMFNGGLAEGDPRRIGHTEERVNHLGKVEVMETPIFQPLRKKTYETVGVNGYDPVMGGGRSLVRGIVKRRSMEALGFEVNPHDLRRTVAAIMQFAGAAVDAIQRLLRHQSADTTAKYIGEIVDLSESMVGKVFELSFAVGERGRAFMRRFEGVGQVERRE
jgi:integrase